MSERLPERAQLRFHRYVAIVIAVTCACLGMVELALVSAGQSSGYALAGYLVILGWALLIIRSRGEGSALVLVVAQMAFWAGLVVVEILLGIEVTSFDFVTTFGTVMMLGVLAGTLAAGSRMVWAVAIGLSVAAWSVAVGHLQGDLAGALWTRAIVATAGVVFTTALVSKLFDQLAHAIVQYQRSRKLQDAIARCSEALLVQTDIFALQEAVKAILEATDADYGYVDRTIDVSGEPGWEVVADAAKTPAGYGSSWNVGVYSAIPTTYEGLIAGKAVVVRTSELEGTERDLYEADGIHAEVLAPVFVEGEFRGSIGFVQYTHDRTWHNTEIQTLWRAADMIGAYWQRQDQENALRASNESKDRLLASVSHEIRTPLTAIVGLSEEIISSRGSLTTEELDELNGIIAAQSRELAELVEDLLVASRADFGNLSIRPETVDMRAQVERVVRGLGDSLRTSKEIVISGEGAEAWADPLRARQVLRNLVTNAIKYGGQTIEIQVVPGGDTASVIVADDGGGIPAEETELIFERYYRSSGSPTQPGSVGIGLAVSRQLAELMGGTLEYVYTADGHHFELTLPAPLRHPVAQEAPLSGSVAPAD